MITSLTLNDGRPIPQIGFGTWQITGDDASKAVREAITSGYRLIDTASAYENEAQVGQGIAESGLDRQELFITTKLWNDQHGFDQAREALRESLRLLQLDHVDLFLIHWPVPSQDQYLEAWRALIQLREEGLTKSIGVSNFTETHLQRIIDETGIVPAVNQIELHPTFTQISLRQAHAAHGILTEAWSPLARGGLLESTAVTSLAEIHGKTPAQVVLRWHLQHSFVVIPKSSNSARIRENLALFDFKLAPDEMASLDALDTGKRIGPDPETFSGV